MSASPARAIAHCWIAHALQSAVHHLHTSLHPTGTHTWRIYVVCVTGDGSKADAEPLVSLCRTLLPQYQATGAVVISSARLNEGGMLCTDSEPTVSDAVDCLKVICMEIDGEEASWKRGQAALTAAAAAASVLLGYNVRKGRIRVAVHADSAAKASLASILAPLEELQEQCGLPIALELLSRLLALSADHRAKGDTKSVPTSMMQLSFQLLLMLLRWSYFHPDVVALVWKPLTRKLALIPQRRVQREIIALYDQYRQLWGHVYPDRAASSKLEVQPTSHRLRLPSIHADDGDEALPPLERLSHCALWDQQKAFYRTQGINAWSDNLIPFGVSSSSYLARQYAKLAVAFLHQHASTLSPPSAATRVPNCYVWEAASGSCKFLHSFLVHFYQLIDEDEFESRLGIVPCVVASDLSEALLKSREELTGFQRFIDAKRLDFALFDTDTFLHSHDDAASSRRHQLYLRHSHRWWHVGREGGPVFIIGNYFLDSLRTDVFVVTQQSETLEMQVREAVIDPTTDAMPDMLFQLKKLDAHPRDTAVYSNAAVNAALVAVLDRIESDWSTDPSSSGGGDGGEITNSSLVLFPTEALEFLDAVLADGRDVDAFPVAVITGDATVSFHDAVPRSFIDYDSGDLMVPQLSPHPDCFCLPVDLQILQLYVASSACGTGAIVATPGSDTFSVFFAQSRVDPVPVNAALEHRFFDIFRHFTPCDCDLLWGMMSVDGGAGHLSFESLVALLRQTAFDFDVFVVIQWPLLRFFHRLAAEQQLDSKPDELDAMRSSLVHAATESLRTMYVLDEGAGREVTAAALLQHARWLYGLGALREVVELLETSDGLRRGSLYLLGLACFHLHEYWAALGWFRKAQQLEPKRLRLKKWVARSLICLQNEPRRTSHESLQVVS